MSHACAHCTDARYITADDSRLGPVGRLVELPIEEYLQLRGAVLARKPEVVVTPKASSQLFSLAAAAAADIELNVTLNVNAIPGAATAGGLGAIQLGFGCGSAATAGGLVNDCGYTLQLTASAAEAAVTVCHHELESGGGAGKCSDFPLLPSEVAQAAAGAATMVQLPVRVMTDTRSIEVFVGDGRAAYSGVLSPAKCGTGGACGVSAAGDGRVAAVAWAMNSITE